MRSYTLFLIAFSILFFFTQCDKETNVEEEIIEYPLGLWEKGSALDATARYGAVSFTIGTKGYLVGGYNDKEYLSDCWEYDMESQIWIQKANFPGLPRSNAIAFSIDGKGYVGTGITDQENINLLEKGIPDTEGMIAGLNYSSNGHLADFWEYNPETNLWTRKTDFASTPRYYATAFAVKGKGYVGLGIDDEHGYMKDFFEYDLSNDSWTQIDFPGSISIGSSAFVIDTVAYLVGGEDKGSLIYSFYKFESNTWTPLRTIINDDDDEYDDEYTTIARVHGTAMVIDGYAYYTLGQQGTSGILNSSTWKYDPTTDLWEEVRKFKGTPRSKAVSFFNGSKVGYISTGQGGNKLDDLWMFNPYGYDTEDY